MELIRLKKIMPYYIGAIDSKKQKYKD